MEHEASLWDRKEALKQANQADSIRVSLAVLPSNQRAKHGKKVAKQSRSFFNISDVAWETAVEANCAHSFPPLFKPLGQGAVTLWLAESRNTKLLLILSHNRWPESSHQQRRTYTGVTSLFISTHKCGGKIESDLFFRNLNLPCKYSI